MKDSSSDWTVISKDRTSSDHRQKKGQDTSTASVDHSKEIIPIPCRFYLLGSCSAGKACKYLHFKHKELKNHPELLLGDNDQPQSTMPLICTYYQNGTCKFGSKCLFLHTKFSSLSLRLAEKSKGHHISAIKLDNDELFENPIDVPRPNLLVTDSSTSLESSSYDRTLFDDPDEDQLFELALQEQKSWLFSNNVAGALPLEGETDEELTPSRQEIASFPYPQLEPKKPTLKFQQKHTSASYSSALRSSLSISEDHRTSSLSTVHRYDINLTGKLDRLCSYSKVGACTFGDRCRYYHGLRCPHCSLFVLHPSDLQERELHLAKCKDARTAGNFSLMLPECDVKEDLSSKLECGICLEPLFVNGTTRFGLLNCSHSFCLECIRSWRASQNVDPSACRSCPICRVVTHFITPSLIWCVDPIQKSIIIDNYKRKLRYMHLMD